MVEQLDMFSETVYSGVVTADHPIGITDQEREKLRNKKSVRQRWVLDVQWSDCPVEVEQEVMKMWEDQELSNDICICKYRISDDKYPLISEWCRRNGAPEDEYIWIHLWW